jgi:pimeloyl-ACP methyl ester carboxylesterase
VLNDGAPGAAPSGPRPDRHVASTDGVVLAVHDLGGDGSPALLCHATGFHGWVWSPLAAGLTGFRRWAPDLRGHGDSTAPEPLTMAWNGFADDVLAVVDALGLDRPVGIGHSKGGAALLLAEQRRPGTFAGLWLYEPVVFPTVRPVDLPEEHPLAVGALRRRDVFGSVEEAVDHFASKPPFDVLDPAVLRAYVEHGFVRAADGVALKCRPEVEAQVYRMGVTHDGFAHLGEVRCPTTVARGAVSGFGPAAVAERIAEALPQGRFVEYPDLGHFGPLEAPARLAAAVREAFGAATPSADPGAG